MSNMDNKKEMDLAEVIQKQMNDFITAMNFDERGKQIPYEDKQAVFYCYKLAELQLQIKASVR